MNNNLTFVLISSRNDLSILNTLNSISAAGKIIIIDGGLRKSKNSNNSELLDLKKISEDFNASYFFREFDYAAKQYNFGINQVQTKWTFIIDSDEVLSSDLLSWLITNKFQEKVNAYYVKRFNYFLGRKMRYGQFRPDWNVRLFLTESCRYEDRPVHARMIFSGRTAKTSGYIEHFTVTTLDDFFLKMIEFTKLEEKSRKQTSDSNEFKAKVRYLLQKTYFQPTLRFIYSFILLRGFLDGKIGYLLAKCASFYETMSEMYSMEKNV